MCVCVICGICISLPNLHRKFIYPDLMIFTVLTLAYNCPCINTRIPRPSTGHSCSPHTDQIRMHILTSAVIAIKKLVQCLSKPTGVLNGVLCTFLSQVRELITTDNDLISYLDYTRPQNNIHRRIVT